MKSFFRSKENNTDAKNQDDPLVQEDIYLETIIDSLEKIDASQRTEEEKKAAIKRIEDSVNTQSLEKMIAEKLKEIDNDTDADALATKLLKINILKNKLIKHDLFKPVIVTVDQSIQAIKTKLDEKIKQSLNPTWVNLSLDEKDNQLLPFEEVKIELHQAHDSKKIEKRIQISIDKRMQIEVIRTLARTYAKKRLPDNNDFDIAVKIVDLQLNESIEEIAEKLRKNRIPLNSADSYKAAAMLKIYLLAEKALNLNQNLLSEMQERSTAEKNLTTAITESANHVFNDNTRDLYSAPKKYLHFIQSIRLAAGFDIPKNSPEKLAAADEVLTTKKKIEQKNKTDANDYRFRFYMLTKDNLENRSETRNALIDRNLWATHDAGSTYLDMATIVYDQYSSDHEDHRIARKTIESIIGKINTVYSDHQPEEQLTQEIKSNISKLQTNKINNGKDIKLTNKNIQKMMWLMHFSHFSFTHLISKTTLEERAVIIAALSQEEDKEILKELQQQRLNHAHTRNDLNDILNELFSLPYGEAYASQKAVFAEVILAHKHASYLDSTTLLKLCSFFIPDKAKQLINDNLAINPDVKQSISSELERSNYNKKTVLAEQENKIYDETIKKLEALKEVYSEISGLENTIRITVQPRNMRGASSISARSVSGSGDNLDNQKEKRTRIIRDIGEKIESLLRLKSDSATQLIDKIVESANRRGDIQESTVLRIFESINDDDNKIIFIEHLFKRGYLKNISQKMMNSYIDHLTKSKAPEVCTQAFNLFSISEYLPQIGTVSNFSRKSSIYAQAILHNANMRKWLSSKKELYQALITRDLKDFPYHAETFTNWTKEDFIEAIGLAESEQAWLLKWALLTNNDATSKSLNDEILKSCFEELDHQLKNNQLSNEQIKAMSKIARIAYLNRLTTLEDDIKLIGAHVDAFIHDFTPADIETYRDLSETLLYLAFNKENKSAIISAITNKEANQIPEIAAKNRKAAWSILNRPDIEKITSSKERHSLIKISVHGYTGNDGYTLNMNSALLSEFSDSRYGSDFQLYASNAAYKAMLSEPDFINAISQHSFPSHVERKSYTEITSYLRFHNRQNFSSADLLDIVKALEAKEQIVPTQPDVKQEHKEQKPASVLVLDELPTFLSNRVMQLSERNKSNEAEVKAIIDSEVNAIKELLRRYNNPPRGFKTIQEHPIISAIDNNKKLPVEVKNMVKSTIIGNDQQLFNQYINENKWRGYTAKDPWLMEFGKDLVKAASAMFLGAVIVRTVSKHFSYLNPLSWLQKIFQPQQESIWNKVLLLGAGALAGGGVSGAATLTTASIVIGGLVGIAGLAAIVLTGRAAADTYRHYAGINEKEKNDCEEISMIFEEYFGKTYGLTYLIKTTDRNKNAATESENKNEASLSPNKTIDTTTKALASMLIFCKERNHDVTANNAIDSNTRDQLSLIMNYHTRGSFAFFWRMFSPKLWNLEKSYHILIKQIIETSLPGIGHGDITQLLAGSSVRKAHKQALMTEPHPSAPTVATSPSPLPINVPKPSAPPAPANIPGQNPSPPGQR